MDDALLTQASNVDGFIEPYLITKTNIIHSIKLKIKLNKKYFQAMM